MSELKKEAASLGGLYLDQLHDTMLPVDNTIGRH
jgi:hypothetical protein